MSDVAREERCECNRLLGVVQGGAFVMACGKCGRENRDELTVFLNDLRVFLAGVERLLAGDDGADRRAGRGPKPFG